MSLKVYLVTSDEPFYLPKVIESILNNCNHYILGVILLSPKAKNRSWFFTAKQFFDLYGIIQFTKKSLYFGFNKIKNCLGIVTKDKNSKSVEAIAKRYSVPVLKPKDINSEDFVKTIRTYNPDLIVSLSASQVFRKNLIDLPNYGVINVHGAPLPKYRGLMPSFWMLLNDEKIGAVTVHFMGERLDSGDIIAQKEFKINSDESQHSLILKSKKIGVDLLLEVLDLFEKKNGNVPRKENPDNEATYFGFPTKKDSVKFRKMGKKFK
jgi:methionyl-tRNA formyltransferase